VLLHFLVGYATVGVRVSCTEHVLMHEQAGEVSQKINKLGKLLDVELAIKYHSYEH
jgi:hypothetical protein